MSSETITFIIRSADPSGDIHPKQLLPSEVLKYVKCFEDAIQGMNPDVDVLSSQRFLSLDKVRDKCVAVDIHATPMAVAANGDIEESLRSDGGSSLSIDTYKALVRLRSLSKKDNLTFQVAPLEDEQPLPGASWHINEDTEIKAPSALRTSSTSISGTIGALNLEKNTLKLRMARGSTLVSVTDLTARQIKIILSHISTDGNQRFKITGQTEFDTKKHRYVSIKASKVEPVTRLSREFLAEFRKKRGPVKNWDDLDKHNQAE